MITIREYSSSDLSAVIALWEACGLVVPQNSPERDIQRKLQVDADLFLVGVKAEQVVASVMGGYEGHRGWINYLAVHPQEQGSGFGRQMMNAVEERLLGKGCPKINLQIRTTNSAVRAFYQSLGYSVDEVVSMGKRLELD